MSQVDLKQLKALVEKNVNEGDLELAMAHVSVVSMQLLGVMVPIMEAPDGEDTLDSSEFMKILMEEFGDVESSEEQRAGVLQFLEGFINGRAEVATNNEDPNYLRGYKLGEAG